MLRLFVRDCKITVPPTPDFLKYHRELRRIGSNIDQILMLANSHKSIDVSKLRNALDELHETQKKLWGEYAARNL